MPPVQALVALHLFWLVLLTPPTVRLAQRLSVRWLRVLGQTMLGVGLLGIATVAFREAWTWLPPDAGDFWKYIGPRVLFVLANLTDLPLVQVSVLGAACWWAARRRQREASTRGVTPVDS